MTEEEQEQEYERIRADAYTDRGTCRFPDSHAPGHPADMKFSVLFDRDHGDWEHLTEDEMIDKYGKDQGDDTVMMPAFTHLSHWDFWYAP